MFTLCTTLSPNHAAGHVGLANALRALSPTAPAGDAVIEADRIDATGERFGEKRLRRLMVSYDMCRDGAQVVAAANKLGALIPTEAARAVPLMQPIKAAPYYAHADFSPPETVLALEDPGDIPYVRTAWHYARGVVLARAGDLAQARSELAAIETKPVTENRKAQA